jgi:aminopeptidase N
MGKTLEKIIEFCKRRKKTLIAGVLSLAMLAGIAGYNHKKIDRWHSKHRWKQYCQKRDQIDVLTNNTHIRVDEEDGILYAKSELELNTRGSDISLILSPNLTIDKAEVNGIESRAARSAYVVTVKNKTDSKRCRLTLEYHGPVKDKNIPRAGITPEISELTPVSHSIPIDSDSFPRYRISIEVPKDKVGIAPGDLVEIVEKENKKVFVYETERIRLPAIIIGRFKQETRKAGDKIFHLYYNNLKQSKKNRLFRNAEKTIRLYSDIFGDLENSTHTIVALPEGGSCYNCFSMTVVHEKRCSLPVISHELAHNWWGNTVRYDRHEDSFNESLAEFSVLLALEEFDKKKFENKLNRMRDFYQCDEFPSIYDTNGFSNQSHAVFHYKAPFALHQLRQTMGDKDFFKGLRQYFQKEKYKTSSVQRFEQIMKQNSSIDLTDFFDEYFRK